MPKKSKSSKPKQPYVPWAERPLVGKELLEFVSSSLYFFDDSEVAGGTPPPILKALGLAESASNEVEWLCPSKSLAKSSY